MNLHFILSSSLRVLKFYFFLDLRFALNWLTWGRTNIGSLGKRRMILFLTILKQKLAQNGGTKRLRSWSILGVYLNWIQKKLNMSLQTTILVFMIQVTTKMCQKWLILRFRGEYKKENLGKKIKRNSKICGVLPRYLMMMTMAKIKTKSSMEMAQ